VVIGTEVFDLFMNDNNLESFAFNETTILKSLKKFIEAFHFLKK